MAQPAAKPPRFTWADYQSWAEDERWEVIGGEAFAMSPGPTSRHQHVCLKIGAELDRYFRGKSCRPFISPMDVKLSDEDIVQPDVLVVCDPRQIKPTHIEGAPALVVEVLSASSVSHDRVRKTRLYARFGVREFWIVTPYPSVVEVLLLDGGSYRLVHSYSREEELGSAAFPDLSIPLTEIFNFPLEPGEEPPQVRERPAVYRSVAD